MTAQEHQPWFQLDFPEVVHVVRIIIVQSLLVEEVALNNVSLFVGEGLEAQDPSNNQLCHEFVRQSNAKSIDVITCNHMVSGKSLIVQGLSDGLQRLGFSEIIVHVADDNESGQHNYPGHEDLLLITTGYDNDQHRYAHVTELFSIGKNYSAKECIHNGNLFDGWIVNRRNAIGNVLKTVEDEDVLVICGGDNKEHWQGSNQCFKSGSSQPFTHLIEKRISAASIVIADGTVLWVTGGYYFNDDGFVDLRYCLKQKVKACFTIFSLF